MLIYKICSRQAWHEAEQLGIYRGAPVDLADGFIHFSTADQVRETAAKHFRNQDDLVVLAVESESLGADLLWETSRGGALFPHLYRPLALSDVLWMKRLPMQDDGTHDFTGLL